MHWRMWGIGVALACVAATGCQGQEPAAVTAPATVEPVAEPTTTRVRYEITAEGGAVAGDLQVAWVQVTEATPSGISQSEQRAPWTSSHDFAPGVPAVVSAQAGTDVTAVSCAIYAGATLLAKETSTGQFAVVSCSAVVP